MDVAVSLAKIRKNKVLMNVLIVIKKGGPSGPLDILILS